VGAAALKKMLACTAANSKQPSETSRPCKHDCQPTCNMAPTLKDNFTLLSEQAGQGLATFTARGCIQTYLPCRAYLEKCLHAAGILGVQFDAPRPNPICYDQRIAGGCLPSQGRP
jgi:hypothetical protein